MSKHIFFCPCYFKHKININEIFIGKRIPTKILEHKGYILFPIAKRDSDFGMKLINPKLDWLYAEYECGDYSKTVSPSGKTIRHPQIAAVFIILEIEDKIENKYEYSRHIIAEIERVISKFIKCISLIHPSSIKWSYAKEEGYIEPIDSYSLVDTGTNEDYGIAAHINVEFRGVLHELTIAEFFQICRNINKDISLQHTLLADVKRCLARCEYREVILNCATIIEKTLKEQIAKYLDSVNTAEIDKNQILDSADGFKKIYTVMKKFGLVIDNCNANEERTIKVRNRIIHGGYYPSQDQVMQAIEDARLIMKQYNVPLFID